MSRGRTNAHFVARLLTGLLPFVVAAGVTDAAVLTGSFASIPKGTVVNLTTAGALDWVHWGLYTETSLDRKAGVIQQISDFTRIGPNMAEQFADNYTAFSWSDGTPTASAADTATGVFI